MDIRLAAHVAAQLTDERRFAAGGRGKAQTLTCRSG